MNNNMVVKLNSRVFLSKFNKLKVNYKTTTNYFYVLLQTNTFTKHLLTKTEKIINVF